MTTVGRDCTRNNHRGNRVYRTIANTAEKKNASNTSCIITLIMRYHSSDIICSFVSFVSFLYFLSLPLSLIVELCYLSIRLSLSKRAIIRLGMVWKEYFPRRGGGVNGELQPRVWPTDFLIFLAILGSQAFFSSRLPKPKDVNDAIRVVWEASSSPKFERNSSRPIMNGREKKVRDGGESAPPGKTQNLFDIPICVVCLRSSFFHRFDRRKLSISSIPSPIALPSLPFPPLSSPYPFTFLTLPLFQPCIRP